MKCSLVSLIFLKRSLVFPILLFSSISLHWSLSKAFLSLHSILWNSAFKWVYLSFSPFPLAYLFSAICKASSDNHFAFFISFSWELSWSLPPVLCHEQNQELTVAAIVSYVVIICSMSHWSLYQEFNKHLFAKWMTVGWFSLLVWKSAATGIVAFSV